MIISDRITGPGERILYGIFFAITIKFSEWGWMTPDMAAYVALGAVSGAGAIYAWIINSPSWLAWSASHAAPKNSTLVITPTPAATRVEKAEMQAMADASGDKVIAKTAA